MVRGTTREQEEIQRRKTYISEPRIPADNPRTTRGARCPVLPPEGAADDVIGKSPKKLYK